MEWIIIIMVAFFLSAYHQSGTMLSNLDILTLSSLQPFEVSPHFAHMETEAERDLMPCPRA